MIKFKRRCGFSNFVVQMLLGFLDLRSTPKVTIPIMRLSKEKIKKIKNKRIERESMYITEIGLSKYFQ